MTARLEKWFVVRLYDGGLSLRGRVTGHPKRADGMEIQTTRVTSATGRVVQTASGTAYELGESLYPEADPDEPLAEFLRGGEKETLP